MPSPAEPKSPNLSLQVFDHGRGFSLSEHLSIDRGLYQSNGRGLQLMNQFMDSITYTIGKNKNELHLVKNIAVKEVENVG